MCQIARLVRQVGIGESVGVARSREDDARADTWNSLRASLPSLSWGACRSLRALRAGGSRWASRALWSCWALRSSGASRAIFPSAGDEQHSRERNAETSLHRPAMNWLSARRDKVHAVRAEASFAESAMACSGCC